jgi:hypothetical protein
MTRGDKTSGTNAILAVVLPDEHGSYEHFIEIDTCLNCETRTLKTENVFEIIGSNMFNHKEKQQTECRSCTSYRGEHSYIPTVDWNKFISNHDRYIEQAISRMENKEEHDLVKTP